jgi:hypothetical protein
MKYLSLSRTCILIASLLVVGLQVQPSSALPPTKPDAQRCSDTGGYGNQPGCYPGGAGGGAYGGSTDDRNNQAASDLNTLSGERGQKPQTATTANSNCIKYQRTVKHKSLEDATAFCQIE